MGGTSRAVEHQLLGEDVNAPGVSDQFHAQGRSLPEMDTLVGSRDKVQSRFIVPILFLRVHQGESRLWQEMRSHFISLCWGVGSGDGKRREAC